MKELNNQTIRVQDKGSRFVILENDDYCSKIKNQLDRSSFSLLHHDPTPSFVEKVNSLIIKWKRKVIDDKWERFIKTEMQNLEKCMA